MSRRRTKTADGEGVQVAFRFTPELVARIDEHVRRLEARIPGVRVTRADAVRALLTFALIDAEHVQDTEASAGRSGGRADKRK